MALARWIEGQERLGNMEAAAYGEEGLRRFGEINGSHKDIPLPSAQQLVEQESKAWGKEVSEPPVELFDVWRHLIEQKITNFEPHAVVQNGAVHWILIESTPKPNFNDGEQAYIDDPFMKILESLRADKKIAKCEFTVIGVDPKTNEAVQISAKVDSKSRFGLSATELYRSFLPKLAELHSLDKRKLRTPSLHEFTMIGGLFHPEWGETNTREWLNDKMSGGTMPHHVVGGNSELGGFNDASNEWDEFRSQGIGFRVVIDFSQPKPKEIPAKTA